MFFSDVAATHSLGLQRLRIHLYAQLSYVDNVLTQMEGSIANGSSSQVHELGHAKIALVETLQHLSVAFQILVKMYHFCFVPFLYFKYM